MRPVYIAAFLAAAIASIAGAIDIQSTAGAGGSDCTTDCTFTSVTTNGTAPSLTATGGVFTSSVSILNNVPNLIGQRHGLTAAPAALLTLNRGTAATDFSTASALGHIGADDFTAGRWNILGFGFIDGDSQLPCAVAEQTMNSGTGGGDIVVLCRTHEANGSTAPSEVARFSATNGVMLGLGATVSTFTSSGKLVLGDNINTTGKYLIGDNSAASGNVPYFRVTTGLVEANAASGQTISFYDTGTNAQVLTPGTGWAFYGSTMTITKAGNLGIGTASPGGKLHVASGAFIVDGSGAAFYFGGVKPAVQNCEGGGLRADSNTNYCFNDSTLAVVDDANGYADLSMDASEINLNQYTGNNVLLRHASSKLGIGTASPTAGLHLSSKAFKMDGITADPTPFAVGSTMTLSSNGVLSLNSGGNPGLKFNGQVNIDAGSGSNILFNGLYGGVGIQSNGYVRANNGSMWSWSRTIAQLLAITPSDGGEMYYCSNCSPAKMVVSTGTSAGNFASIDGGAFQ